MFTGITEEVGTVKSIIGGGISGRLAITAHEVLAGTKVGDSIAVNGVCLTVTTLQTNGFTADVMAETLRRSNLGQLKNGSQVNLERAMAADGRFGGHLVSGHIDGLGIVVKLQTESNALWLTIVTPAPLLRYIVEKGSVAIDGVSLTVATVADQSFQVSLIPHTRQQTTLLAKKVGAQVNLETDLIAKYVEKLLQPQTQGQPSTALTLEFLQKHGF